MVNINPSGNAEIDLVYKSTPQKELMLTFLPPINKVYKSAPVYFIIPGGGWHVEKKEDMIWFSRISANKLREKGFAVVAIDYRVCTDGIYMNEIITDCFDAARYIARFADTLGIDKNSFFLSGHSAGGHLALMLAYAPQNEFKGDYDDEFGVKVVVTLSPATMIYDKSTHNLRNINDVYAEENIENEMKRTCPDSYINKNCPPTLLCAGTSDYLVFANSSERLYKILQENNVECELVLSVGGGHCFEQIHETLIPSISAEEIQSKIIEFTEKYL